MTHELFKVFRYNQENPSEEIQDFLNSPDIIPKSISISKFLSVNFDPILVIGFVDVVDEFGQGSNGYKLVHVSIPDAIYLGVEGIEREIMKAASVQDGVICQDVRLFAGNLDITFLTTK